MKEILGIRWAWMGCDHGDDYDKMELQQLGWRTTVNTIQELTARTVCGSFGCKGLTFWVP